MDRLEQRLREDAGRLDAEVSPGFRQRLEQRLREASPAQTRWRFRPLLAWFMVAGMASAAIAFVVYTEAEVQKPVEMPVSLSAVEVAMRSARPEEPLTRELEALHADLDRVTTRFRTLLGDQRE